MDVSEIPFNRLIGITWADRPEGSFLQLCNSENVLNHLKTLHASAQFALAEAASGECLIQTFKDLAGSSLIPVVRSAQVKYRRPAASTLRAIAKINDADKARAVESIFKRGRGLISVEVNLLDDSDITSMTATFLWFIQKG